ncbi:8106_t:CDS:2 [Racocetra persica]|uniref:8106_t:CDS:1 n=1 Tax=Racocetra persica TaxID=160502 RepID=A0ACA9PWL5_9GLOM|nr:8106_t:CDS:2 [Racocetra persica]
MSQRSSQASQIIATNTLIITNVNQATFLPENLEKLKGQLEQYGTIYKFVPTKSFNRTFVTFYKTTDAKNAKDHFDKSMFLEKTIRVYFGQHISIYETDNARHLNVPELEKNLLISPPGSPPVGWIQSREDHPNSITLSDDLVHAFAKFYPDPNNNIDDIASGNDDFEEFTLDDKIEPEDGDIQTRSPILTVIPSDVDVDYNTNHESNPDVPLILIQNWDDSPPPSTKTKKPNLQVYNNGKAQLRPNVSIHSLTPTPRPPLFSTHI